MLVVQLANPLDFLHRSFVTQMTPQCVGAVCRVYDDAPPIQNINRLIDQPGLGVLWVYLKELTHNITLGLEMDGNSLNEDTAALKNIFQNMRRRLLNRCKTPHLRPMLARTVEVAACRNQQVMFQSQLNQLLLM